MYYQKLATVLTRYSLPIRAGQEVAIMCDVAAQDAALEIYKEVLKLGAYPTLLASFGNARDYVFKYGTEDQITHKSYLLRELYSHTDHLIRLVADENTKVLSNVEPRLIALQQTSLRDIVDIMMERETRGEYHWTLTVIPTNAMAQEAGMSLDDYRAFVFGAELLDDADPIASWQEVSRSQQHWCDWLTKRSEFRFVGKDTDLSMSCAGRTWINCNGDNNMPDGEVFTGPVEDSAEGTIRFTYPGIHDGREIEDITLTFKEGRVVSASAAKGGDLLEKTLETDDGSRGIGEIAIGTNYGIQTFTKNMLFDEKMGGTMHLALGAGYPESGSKAVSSLHWDMLKEMRDGGKVYADGELFYENGLFVI
jgi:aminopeptidase